MEELDLWVLRFDPDRDPVAGLQASFGLDADAAARLVEGAPSVVKRSLGRAAAAPWIAVLEELGAEVALRPAGSPAPGPPRATFGRGSLRPSSPGEARPPSADAISEPGSADELGAWGELALDAEPEAPPEPAPAPPGVGLDHRALDLGEVGDLPPLELDEGAPASAPHPAAAYDAQALELGPAPGPELELATDGAPAADGVSFAQLDQRTLDLEEPALAGPPLELAGDGPADPADLPTLDDGPAPADPGAYGELPALDGTPDGPPGEEAPARGAFSPEELDLASDPGEGRRAPHRDAQLEREMLPRADARTASQAPGRVVEEGGEDDERRQLLTKAAGLLVGGALPSIVGLVMGKSVFLGNASLFGVAFEGVGLGAFGFGAFVLLAVLALGPERVSVEFQPGAIATALGIAAAFGLNVLLQASPEELAAERLRAITEGLGSQVAPEAGAFLERPGVSVPGGSVSALQRFVADARSAGARGVYVADPAEAGGTWYVDELIIDMPDPLPLRRSIERAYRRYLGFRASEHGEAAQTAPPSARLWFVGVSFEGGDEAAWD
ncbi:MAG TPA: hypothetical protein RMH85_11025 [Polyangiaceae bacterium LLY-WYZ-15_(1-7)]|nr:hypothetical protein [Polyangiaceae bacterium LLY-WYZ-15_(1-7)]HJL09026.1 hypothetical protein [Polyangiaceae bacterium LLY-WYZ-15_(1-7)]HJL26109.1 hypothetical protein [Polyangiaceae bacterium LLY-WYZ-15_(1-7)]HJL38435.1 hypothetical protein [Polyangiaceae bacterium LLY-WYZ-15_(1-7)]HJL50068.1 hypothetical protein [Polyangiaceae bacterium LLY-WYZ-15_(1-7)]